MMREEGRRVGLPRRPDVPDSGIEVGGGTVELWHGIALGFLFGLLIAELSRIW